MEFRWVAVITLWTLLAGPVFNAATTHRAPRAQQVGQAQKAKTATPAPPAVQR